MIEAPVVYALMFMCFGTGVCIGLICSLILMKDE
jgi:hypothetical protein